MASGEAGPREQVSVRFLPAGAVLVLAMSACTDGSPPEPSPTLTAVSQPSPTASAAPSPSPSPQSQATAPLTGEPMDDRERWQRRVLAVKIDNHPAARPQTGIEEAELVYELLVESGLTRFIALFHAGDTSQVGPVRSGRPTDIGLVGPVEATFAISGAQGWVRSALQEAGVHLIEEVGPPATFRMSGRSAPHNLYVDTAALRAVADERGYPDQPPAPPLSRGPLGDDVPTSRASAIVLRWSDATTVRWEWDVDRWERLTNGEQHAALTPAGGFRQVAADVLVVLVGTRTTARPPGQGTAVPATRTTGSGRALVLSDHQVVDGTWARAAETDPFTLLTDEGSPLTVPPGRTWVSVLPDTGVIEVAR